MSLNVKLVVVGGETKTTEVILNLPATIGRGRGASIVLPHPLVSRQHCELFESSGQLMVRDSGSLNGTFVNNERISDATALPANHLLTIGTVTFRAVYEDLVDEQSESEAIDVNASDKTVQMAKSRTISTPPARPGATSETINDRLDLDAAAHLLPPAAADSQDEALPPTEQLQSPRADKDETRAGADKASKQGKKSPRPPQIMHASDEDLTVEVSESQDDDETQSPSSSDDDLNDFLKGLDK